MESDLQVVHLSAGAKVVTCFWPSQATSYLMERSPTKRAADVCKAVAQRSIIPKIRLWLVAHAANANRSAARPQGET